MNGHPKWSSEGVLVNNHGYETHTILTVLPPHLEWCLLTHYQQARTHLENSLQNSNASTKQTSFRTAVSNARSETCQKQPVPRKQLLFIGDCLHREGLPSLKPQEEKYPVNPCIAQKHLLTLYCHKIIVTSTNATTSQSSLEAQLAKNAKMRVMYISIIHFWSDCR